ncbi:hypothetical protein B0H17DRAFT_1186187 [Mycena rosella]|uniref:Uncharacterized protein n=1 Tax=Mycena rosella TaxID=1033263 RepID=A0AAD7CND5_MYCRO|nr:hypothetical protein B0H17DRAFT_1186187 [Mycena rosella]
MTNLHQFEKISAVSEAKGTSAKSSFDEAESFQDICSSISGHSINHGMIGASRFMDSIIADTSALNDYYWCCTLSRLTNGHIIWSILEQPPCIISPAQHKRAKKIFQRKKIPTSPPGPEASLNAILEQEIPAAPHPLPQEMAASGRESDAPNPADGQKLVATHGHSRPGLPSAPQDRNSNNMSLSASEFTIFLAPPKYLM